MDKSAHPGSPEFDPTFATQVMGDIAEELRGILSGKFQARPPGLRTEYQQDGSLRVVADDPLAGIGLTVTVSLLNVPPTPPIPGLPAPGAATNPLPSGGGSLNPVMPVSPQVGPPSAASGAMAGPAIPSFSSGGVGLSGQIGPPRG